MSVSFDEIMANLAASFLTPAAAGEILANELRSDPQRTRFWPQRLQAAIASGRISASMGRALFDAIETFQPDRTTWLDGKAMQLVPALAVSAPAAQKPQPIARSPASALADIESLRAALFDSARAVPASGLADDSRPQETTQPRPAQPQRSLGLNPPSLGTEVRRRYRLTAALGLGGAGHFFNAVDLHEGREVTLALIAVDLAEQSSAYEALQAEVHRARNLAHPNIAATYEIDRDEDRAFIVMEPLRGRWLSQLVREVRGQGLAYETAWPIILGVTCGLANAHAHGVLHRDLSPNSVFLCDDGTPKIVGFGLLRAAPGASESPDALDTQTLRAYSEAYVASPPDDASTAHPADDLYPLGVMAYELLAGIHPFRRLSLIQARQQQLAYAPMPKLNKHTRTLIERCLSFERETRPNDASQLIPLTGADALFGTR